MKHYINFLKEIHWIIALVLIFLKLIFALGFITFFYMWITNGLN